MDAFAPASVTAVFAPAASESGSRGASVALEDGVTVSVDDAAETTVAVDGEPAAFEPVSRVLDRLGVAASVDVRPEVPLGAGFGASGAATLATALAANERFDLGRSREQLLDDSHEAEVAAGTGLGDVFVQEMGGLVVGDGETRRSFDREDPVEYVSFGSIATEEALADEELMARIEREGTAALDALGVGTDHSDSSGDGPTLADVTREGWRFAQAIDLPTDEVRETVAAAEAEGGVASMAMVGETVFAVDVDDVLPNRTAVCPDGAELR